MSDNQTLSEIDLNSQPVRRRLHIIGLLIFVIFLLVILLIVFISVQHAIEPTTTPQIIDSIDFLEG